jgi:hypothetical protein
MILEGLTQLDFLNGIFSLLFVVVAFIIGIKLISVYFKYQKIEMITVGLTWIFLSSAWWGIVVLFLGYVLFDYRIGTIPYLIIGNIFVPVALVCWIYSFSSMTYPEHKKTIVLIYSVISIIYEIILLILLFIDYRLIGYFETEFYLVSEIYPTIYQIFAVVTAIITGIIFTKKALESEDEEIKWKGRFLLTAFITFTIAAFAEAIVLLTPLLLVIMRIILIFSTFAYYLGFFLPKFVSKRLIS